MTLFTLSSSWAVVIVVLLLVALLCSCAVAEDQAAKKQWAHKFEMVPMKDGTKLATHITFPEGEGPWPVVLVVTPYAAKDVAGFWESERLLENGYCIVAQDIRGHGESEGKATAFEACGWGEKQDGYECVEWVARQPWCSGKIGTWGKSGPGITQVLIAGAAPPSLTCQHIGLACADLYRDSFFQGGELRLAMTFNWLHAGGWDLKEHARMGLDHLTYDDFWAKRNLNEPDTRPGAPVLAWSGWYDIFSEGTINTYLAAKRRGGPRAKNDSILIMGPWPHGIAKDFGQAHLPFDALTPPMIDSLLYFDYYLKGIKNELADAKSVYYYTIGDLTDPECKLNRWRSADDWPIPCEYTPMYIHGDGSMSWTMPEAGGAPRSFIYDPKNPVPTLGGNNLFLDKGPFDNRELEKRPDVLVYTSAPLDDDMEVTGRVKVKLYVSSSAKDTDFTAKLCDVYPDGRSFNVLDSIVRMRFTDDFTKQRLLEPGKIYEAEIDLWSTSWVFRKGHSIRLDISSSNYPRFEANPNTGEVFPVSVSLDDPQKPNPDWKTIKARNTVFADEAHPSCVILPVIK